MQKKESNNDNHTLSHIFDTKNLNTICYTNMLIQYSTKKTVVKWFMADCGSSEFNLEKPM